MKKKKMKSNVKIVILFADGHARIVGRPNEASTGR